MFFFENGAYANGIERSHIVTNPSKESTESRLVKRYYFRVDEAVKKSYDNVIRLPAHSPLQTGS